MKILKKAFLAAAVAGAFAVGPANAAVVIDLFTDPIAVGGQSVEDNNLADALGVFNEYDGGATIIGGSRDLYVETMAATLGSQSTEMTAGGGFLSYSQGSGVTGYGAVQWDGNDNSATLDEDGLGGADLTDCTFATCDRITATVLQADFGFGYAITIIDMAGNKGVLTASTQFPVASPTTADYFFEWFNRADGTYFDAGLLFDIDHTGGDIDFSNIGSLMFELNVPFGLVGAQADIDLTLSAITTSQVPEPGALALVGIALVGAAVAGRRRKTLSA